MTAQMTLEYFRLKFRAQKNIHFRSECLNKVFRFCEVYTDKPVVTFHTFGKLHLFQPTQYFCRSFVRSFAAGLF